MSRRALSISVLATLLFMGGVSAQAAEAMFTVRVENVSVGNILKLSNGKTAAVTVAPVLYVIHTNRGPLFTSGEPDRGKGLEALAEDGPTGPLECGLHRHAGWGQRSRRYRARRRLRVQGHGQARRAADHRHDVRTVQRPVLRSQGGRHRPVRRQRQANRRRRYLANSA